MTDLATTSQVYAARPKISVDGNPEPTVEVALLALTIDETADGLYACEATFGNWGASAGTIGYLHFDRQLLDFGKGLEVEAGDGEAAGTIFDGRITALEGRYPRDRSPEILILAEDRLQDLRMVRRSRTFEDVGVSDVIDQIASDHGLTAEVDVDGPTYRVLAQLNQSDLAFARECARMVDAELWVEGRSLHAKARARRRTTELSLTYAQRLLEFQVCADLAGQRTSVTVGGYDVATKEAIAFEATESAVQSELEGGESGAALLQQALGARPDSLIHSVPLDEGEAEASAQAHFRHIARGFITGRGLAEGDSRLRAGTRVTLRGLGELFNGAYYVSRVSHRYDLEQGYRTHFAVERAALGGA